MWLQDFWKMCVALP